MSVVSVDSFLKWELKTTQYQKIPLTPQGSPPLEKQAPSSNLLIKTPLENNKQTTGAFCRTFTRIVSQKKSWILMEYPASPSSHEAESSSASLQGLERFLSVHQDLVAVGVPVPQVQAVDKKAGLILVEDLGDLSLEACIQQDPLQGLSFYKQAIEHIVLLQEHRVEWPKFSDQDFFKEMLWTKTYLVDELYSFLWKKDLLDKCFKEWDELSHTLKTFPYRPAHRDFHSQNLLIVKGKVYWIDFQSAGLFPRCYDLASLLYDPYTNLSSSMREELLAYLVSVRACSKTACGEELFLVAVQRLFKACGSFASFYCLRKQSSHLPYIPRALKTLLLLLQQIRRYPCFLQLVQQLLAMPIKPNKRS